MKKVKRKLALLLLVVFFPPILTKRKMPKYDYGTVLAIDFGATNSYVEYAKNGHICHIILDKQGHNFIPNYVYFNDTAENLVGFEAKNLSLIYPLQTVFEVKLMLGRRWSDPKLQMAVKKWPFEVVNVDGKPHVNITVGGNKQRISAENITAVILRKIKAVAEFQLLQTVSYVVLTELANFDDDEFRNSLKRAAELAGLTVLRFLREPSAACLAYRLDTSPATDVLVFVIHLGGRTFDASVVLVDNGVCEILASHRDEQLGGNNFNELILRYFVQNLIEKTGKDIQKDKLAFQKLILEVEKAKKSLSDQQEVAISVESILYQQNFLVTLTREKFEEVNKDLFDAILKPIDAVLSEASIQLEESIKKEDIQHIILEGGSTRIPKIEELLQSHFSGQDFLNWMNRQDLVVSVAAKMAEVVANEDDGEYSEAVTNPLALGIETIGGVFTPIIPEDTVIPAKKSELFTTVADKQTTVTVRIYEGLRPLTENCHFVTEFNFSNIVPAAKGGARIEITFEIDVNGVLHVTTEDLTGGVMTKFTVPDMEDNRLTGYDIDRMVEEADEFEEDDEKMSKKIALGLDLANNLNTNQLALAATIEVIKSEL